VTSSVLDASALLALILQEPGSDTVQNALRSGVVVSSVNLSEVVAKLTESLSETQIREQLDSLRFETADFRQEDAWQVGLLRPGTRHLGLSLGDRACLALALRMSLPVLTADRSWADLRLGVSIEFCR
jgi:ribonuclease VapC